MADSRDEFYVGYLPTPPRCLRVVRVLVMVLAVWIVGMGVVMAAFMRAPGDAVWDTGAERTWTGTVRADPYPMLVPHDGSPALLIVGMGKAGAHERLEPFVSTGVEVKGYLLERDGRRIIELSPGDSAIAGLSGSQVAPPQPAEHHGEPAVLLGEIVDGKCYLGAMKPGDGVTHKACATLCIRGGLPPMFVTQTPDGPVFRLLLVDGVAALPEGVLRLVAEPVRLSGELVEIAGLPAVRVSAGGIGLAP